MHLLVSEQYIDSTMHGAMIIFLDLFISNILMTHREPAGKTGRLLLDGIGRAGVSDVTLSNWEKLFV